MSLSASRNIKHSTSGRKMTVFDYCVIDRCSIIVDEGGLKWQEERKKDLR